MRLFRNLGYLSDEQIEEAREVAKTTRAKDIRETLLSIGMFGDRAFLQSKAQEMGYAFADFDRIIPDPDAISAVPPHLARAGRAFPLKKQGNNLWVALADPSNLLAMDAIRAASGLRVIPVLAVPEQIDAAIQREYPIPE
ncbi:Type IV fimbrial assembly, ATPase PilB [Fimbriimonas ginsengisoli Gsoil 348]|uniref:Type IV fimbrial assembly, ATPase PilB n=1 Tax=Fimbriimonas ginsengisoli Gsoil 348 TaxID=661478 RepID=A0A068NT24_FIMGI|nr:Type IV fimbrial assembly, ATPase PilB [Fimbriimonas ginsengisoli Gsoil 348]